MATTHEIQLDVVITLRGFCRKQAEIHKGEKQDAWVILEKTVDALAHQLLDLVKSEAAGKTAVDVEFRMMD